MFCSNCGKEIAAGAKFCANCGAAVNGQPTPAEEPPKAPPPTAQREVPTVERMDTPNGNETENGGQPGKKKKGVPKKPLIIIAAVLVLIVGFGAVLSLFGDGSEPDSGSEGSKVQDWVEKIPLVPVNNELLSDETAEFLIENGTQTSYSEIASDYENADDPSKWFGMPMVDDAEYYAWGGGNIIRKNSETIYSLNLYPEPKIFSSFSSKSNGTNVISANPLVARNNAESKFYLLMCKNNNAYDILVTLPTDPTSHYSTWPILAYIVVPSKEYCGFLNETVPVEIISIPGESDTKGNFEAGNTETDYSQYAGIWASGDVGWIGGGQILDITVSGNTMTATFEHIASAPTSQLAEVSVSVPLSSISNGTVSTTFDNDNWGHSGTIALTFTQSGIVCDIKDVEGGEPYLTWGVSEATYLLIRDSGAHEKMIYDMDVYYEMFPEDSPQQTPTSNSTTASGILADLGMRSIEDFKFDCTPLNIMDLRTIREHPGDYTNRHFTMSYLVQVTDKGTTADGYTAYEIVQENSALLENYIPPMLLFDYRDDVYSPTISVGDYITPYMIFTGMQTIDGIDILGFALVTADKR